MSRYFPESDIRKCVEDLAAVDDRVAGKNSEDGTGRDGLARAGLAHDAQDLAGREVKADVPHGVDGALIRVEVNGEVFDFEYLFRHGIHLFLGSSASLRPSPMKCRLSMVRQMAATGHTICIG